MPVEINEIIIKATANEQNPLQTANADTAVNTPADVVKLCVEEVLRILKEKEER